MTKSISLLLATGLLGISLSATSQDMADNKPMTESKLSMTTMAKAMDTNGDGMVSKAEFIQYHEGMYNSMSPNAEGMIDIRPATKMKNRMMMGGKTMVIDSTLMGARADGMVTKSQYMKYHEDMYKGMQLNNQSMVDMKTMIMN